jgi:glutamate-1-semialdehyde 2,1-aminomutase
VTENVLPLNRDEGTDVHGAFDAQSYYNVLLSERAGIEDAYRRKTERSRQLYERASTRLPGGCTRDAALRDPYPLFLKQGAGSRLHDVDGNVLIDFWFNATSLIHGHVAAPIEKAVAQQLKLGSAFYAPTENEWLLAEEICGRLLGADMARFCNSGSEAVMMALRIARGYTGRSLIAKFEGSYHGSYDDVSWSVGPALEHIGEFSRPRAVPEGAGLPVGDHRTIVLPFNDLEASATLIRRHAKDLAAIILEPLANRMGFIEAERDFVLGLRQLCDTHGIILIFDEVISFRASQKGMQGLLGIAPDLTTLGKIVGGGFPVGAVAGRAEIMNVTHPSTKNRVTHTGTFNGNPVTIAAGLATLRELTPVAFGRLDELGEYARGTLRQKCANAPLNVSGLGSFFKITAVEGELHNYRDSVKASKAWESLASLALLTKGCFLSAGLQGCVSTVTSHAEIDRLADAVESIVR